MSQTSIHIDPLSTNCVLKSLGLAIDEIKLVRAIEDIQLQVSNRDASQLATGRNSYLVSELRFLNKRLQAVRDKAQVR